MPSFWKVVNEVIRESDLIIIVLDARFPEETRNKEIEYKLKRLRKKIIYVLNKSDLLNKKLEDIKLSPCILLSAKNNLGTTSLRKLILKNTKRPLIIGVLGYPNTGKSSLINVLKQRKSARTSPNPGFTRGVQKIRLTKDVYLLDTPGVIPYEEKDELKHSLISAIDPSKLKDPDIIAMKIIEIALNKDKTILEKIYNIKIESENPEEIIEKIAIKSKWLIKGGLPNIDYVSRKIISDWQRGKIIL